MTTSRIARFAFGSLVALAMVAGPALAFEPPSENVRDALAKGQVAVLGRVVCVKETKRSPMRTLATSRVEVLECLYGTICEKSRELQVEFASQSIDDPEAPIVMPVSQRVLLVFTRDITGKVATFRSGKEGYDFAYVAFTLPEAAQDDGPLVFSNAYLERRPAERIALDDLKRWGMERREQLKGATRRPAAH